MGACSACITADPEWWLSWYHDGGFTLLVVHGLFLKALFMKHRSFFCALVAIGFLGNVSVVLGGYTVTDLTPTDLISAGNPVYPSATTAAISSDGAQQGGSGFYAPALNSPNHALVWSGTAASFQDLNPDGASSSLISGVSSGQQVGTATFSGAQQAGYWLGNNTFHALPSPGFLFPEANAVSGNVIVGDGGAASHALMWQGTPGTGYALTDLHPGAAYISSSAAATDGVTIAGAVTDTDSDEHAAVWKVSDDSFTDLSQVGYHDTAAQGVFGNQVVGFGAPDGDFSHALLWTFNGSSYDLTDLTPDEQDISIAYGTNGSEQVGEVGDDILEPENAYVWSETTDGSGTHVTAIDLQGDLDAAFPGMFVSSSAQGIDAAGDIVGFAIDQSGNSHAILWSAAAVGTPEPASLGLLAMAFTGGIMLKRRKK